ncbi:MAG: glycosyltransferase family 4 protein [Kiritimatiellia bacterium]
MRVCMIVSGYWPLPPGGTERQCRLLAHSLSELGAACTVLTTRPRLSLAAREMDGPVRVVRTSALGWVVAWLFRLHRAWTRVRFIRRGNAPAGGPPDWFVWLTRLSFMAGAAIHLLLHRRKFDVLHVHTTEWIAGFAALLGERLGLPVLCKEASDPVLLPPPRSVPFRSRMEPALRTVHFQAITPSIRRGLISAHIPDDQIISLPNGVKIPAERAEPGDSNLLLSVANFSQGAAFKGFDVLLDAWADLAPRFPAWTLVMVGGGDDRPWRERAAVLGLAGRVVFAGAQNDPGIFYQRAAVLVFASRTEGMSNVLLEAQAWGLPAVVSDIPGNREVVVENHTGCFFPSGSPEGLVRRLEPVMNSPGLRRNWGAAARDHMMTHFGIERIAARLVSVYAALAAQRAADGGRPHAKAAPPG